MFAKIMPTPRISFEILSTLMLLLAGSALTFWALVRRWESHRQWLALAEWGRENGFRSTPIDPAHLPPPLHLISARQPAIRLSLSNQRTRLIQLQSMAVAEPTGSAVASGNVVWNILVRRLETIWYPTGLRPAAPGASFLDLFSLSSFPTLGNIERFMVFGTDSAAARALSESMTRALLPPDIGMFLHGNQLVLDFSQRPFDEIEFNRMIALAEQIVEKLPTPV